MLKECEAAWNSVFVIINGNSGYQAATRKKKYQCWLSQCSSFIQLDFRFTPWKKFIGLSLWNRRNCSGCAQRKDVYNSTQQPNETGHDSSKLLQFLRCNGVRTIDQLETPKETVLYFCHSGNSLFSLQYDSHNGNGCLLPSAAARLIFTSIFNEIWCRMRQQRTAEKEAAW